MKKVTAIINHEKQEEIIEALGKFNYLSITKNSVLGHGKQKGINLGTVRYDGLVKVSITIVTDKDNVSDIVKVISDIAYSGKYGDGKIFIDHIEEVVEVTF